MKTTLIAIAALLLAASGPAGAQAEKDAGVPALPKVPGAALTPEEKTAAEKWAAEALAAEERAERDRRRLRGFAEKAKKAEEKARAEADQQANAAVEEKLREQEAASTLAAETERKRAGEAEKVRAAEAEKVRAAEAEKSRAVEAEKIRAAEFEKARASDVAAKARAAATSSAPAGVASGNAEVRSAPAANYVERRDGTTAWASRAPLTANQALLRSTFIPGLGQIQTGRPIRGYTFLGAAALSLGSAVWLTARAAQANNIYESAPITVRQEAYDQARSYANSRNTMIAMTAIVWSLNMAEAYFLHGTTDR